MRGHLRALEAEQGRVDDLLRRERRPAGPIVRGTGGLIWPVVGPVVSPFGERWSRLHTGVDIAVPAGTAIRAADSGQVIVLGTVGGYGKYICIQHSARLVSCYAHLSAYATRKGAGVRQGEVIGYVGCTGRCYGDHLHFETRLNGTAVDPMRYLGRAERNRPSDRPAPSTPAPKPDRRAPATRPESKPHEPKRPTGEGELPAPDQPKQPSQTTPDESPGDPR